MHDLGDQAEKFYLLDLWRNRLEFPDLRREIVRQALEYGAQAVLIEKSGLGLQLVQELRRDTNPSFPNPIGITPEGDKEMRMEAQTPRIEAGHVFLPSEAPWLAALLEELLAFPHGKYDDQVDSVSQFLKWAWASAGRSSGMVAAPVLIIIEDD